MFCDLVGSTSISAQLDAEEWRDQNAAYENLLKSRRAMSLPAQHRCSLPLTQRRPPPQ
jgi:hypothetical protein